MKNLISWNGKEKRKHPRGEAHCRVYLFTADKRIIDTYSWNISSGGLQVCLKKRLKAGARVKLEIYLYDDPLHYKGKVVWVKRRPCRRGKTHLFDTGIKFLQTW